MPRRASMICALGTDIEDPRVRLETVVADSTKAKELSSPLKRLLPLVTDTVSSGPIIGIF